MTAEEISPEFVYVLGADSNPLSATTVTTNVYRSQDPISGLIRQNGIYELPDLPIKGQDWPLKRERRPGQGA